MGLNSEPFRTCFGAISPELTSQSGIAGFYEATEKLKDYRERGEPTEHFSKGVSKGHADHLERFARHVQGEGENPCPVESAIVVTRVALKLLDSARLGLPIKVGPEDYDVVQYTGA